jgi:hypothetical protein
MGLTELDKNTNGPLSHHGKLNFCSYLYLRQSTSFGRFEEFGTFTFRVKMMKIPAPYQGPVK